MSRKSQWTCSVRECSRPSRRTGRCDEHQFDEGQQRAAELWAALNIAGIDGELPDAATTARVASAYRAALDEAEARGRAEDFCDDCGHRYGLHVGSCCWGRIVFDDALDDGGLCGCNEFVKCDCGCWDEDDDR